MWCQSGSEEVLWSHQLQGEDLRRRDPLRDLDLLWQRGRDGVRLERGNRCLCRLSWQVTMFQWLNGECFLGDQVEVYSELGYSSAVHAVAFHPHENMVAFCAFGQGQPVHVYLYDHKGSCEAPPTVGREAWRAHFLLLAGPQPELQSLKVASRSASEMGTLRNTPDPPVGVEAARRALKLQSVRQRLDSVLVNAEERFVDVNPDSTEAPPLSCQRRDRSLQPPPTVRAEPQRDTPPICLQRGGTSCQTAAL